MKKVYFLFFVVWGLQTGYGIKTSIYLLDTPSFPEATTLIRGTPSSRLSEVTYFGGWFKREQWIRIELSDLAPNTIHVFSTGSQWTRVRQAFFYDTNGLPHSIFQGKEVSSFFFPSGFSAITVDIELVGTPLLISPHISTIDKFFQRKLIVSLYIGIIGIVFCGLLLWYGFWAFQKRDKVRIWKSINFLLLAILSYYVFFPFPDSLSFLLILMSVFGMSWTGYQLYTHPEMKRPDILLLHGLFSLLLVALSITALFNIIIGFFLFGIAIHFNLILLIFYYRISKRLFFLPWHLFFLISWIGFFWEMVGFWTRFSPLTPWFIVLGLLTYLLVECWETFKDIYLNKSLYTFYQNTNKLLKGHLAQSNRKLQQTVVALKKESQQKTQLAHLYEIQQKKYRDLVENLSDWIWEMDNHLIITYTSPQIQQLAGISPTSALKKSLEHIIGREAFFVFKRVLAQSEGKLRGHLLSLDTGERQVLLEVSTTPFLKDGQQKGYHCIARDVSQLIMMRSDLSTYQKDFSLLFDKSPLAMAIIDLRNMVFYRWNKRFEELFPLEKNHLTNFIEKINDPYAKDLYFSLKNMLSQQNQEVFSLSFPHLYEGKSCWLVLQGYQLSFNEHHYLIITLFPPEFHFFEKQWGWISTLPLPALVIDKYGKTILSNPKAQETSFHPSLSLPFPTEITTLSYNIETPLLFIPFPPFLNVVISLPQNHTTTKPIEKILLQHFPIPWVIVDKDFHVLSWHPSIFETFHFHANHSQLLSQMLRESGLTRQILFSETPSYRTTTAYLRNKQEEIFQKEVHSFISDQYALLLFFDPENSFQKENFLPIFTHQLSIFVDNLKEIAKELQEMKTPPVSEHISPSPDIASLSSLTETEKKILTLLVQGKSNAEIAKIQEISEETVKGHIKRVFKKLGVTKRYQLIQRYHGLL